MKKYEPPPLSRPWGELREWGTYRVFVNQGAAVTESDATSGSDAFPFTGEHDNGELSRANFNPDATCRDLRISRCRERRYRRAHTYCHDDVAYSFGAPNHASLHPRLDIRFTIRRRMGSLKTRFSRDGAYPESEQSEVTLRIYVHDGATTTRTIVGGADRWQEITDVGAISIVIREKNTIAVSMPPHSDSGYTSTRCR